MTATRTTILFGISILMLIAVASYSLYLVKGYPAIEMRKTACYTADDAQTCTTRLADIGISVEKCCTEFSKCCPSPAAAPGGTQ